MIFFLFCSWALCFSSEERFQAWDQPRLGLLPDQETDFFGGRSSTVTMRGSELFARLYSYSSHEPPWKGVQLDAEFTFDVPSPILDSEMSAHELKTYLQSFLGLNPKSPWDRMQTNEKRLDWLRKAQYVIPITNKLIEPVERDGKKLLPIFVNVTLTIFYFTLLLKSLFGTASLRAIMRTTNNFHRITRKCSIFENIWLHFFVK